jgi:hypothetical protein
MKDRLACLVLQPPDAVGVYIYEDYGILWCAAV